MKLTLMILILATSSFVQAKTQSRNGFTINLITKFASERNITCSNPKALEVKAEVQRICDEKKTEIESNFDRIALQNRFNSSIIEVEEKIGCQMQIGSELKPESNREFLLAGFQCTLKINVQDDNFTLLKTKIGLAKNNDCGTAREAFELTENVLFKHFTDYHALFGGNRCDVYQLIRNN